MNLAIIPLKKLFDRQQTVSHCQLMQKVDTRQCFRVYSRRKDLVYQITPLKGFLRIIVPEALLQAVLYNGRHPVPGEHPCTRRMCDNLRCHLYCPHLVSDVYSSVKNVNPTASIGVPKSPNGGSSTSSWLDPYNLWLLTNGAPWQKLCEEIVLW